jgi:hypothetical protein
LTASKWQIHVLAFQSLRRWAHDAGRDQSLISGMSKEEKLMKKSWKKPTMCTVAVGLEMSRYHSAELKAKK